MCRVLKFETNNKIICSLNRQFPLVITFAEWLTLDVRKQAPNLILRKTAE